MANISVYLHLLLLFISGFVITSATYGAGNDNADNYFLENMQLREEFDVIVAWACGTCLDMNSGRISRPPPIDAETPKSTALYMSMAMFVMYNTLVCACDLIVLLSFSVVALKIPILNFKRRSR